MNQGSLYMLLWLSHGILTSLFTLNTLVKVPMAFLFETTNVDPTLPRELCTFCLALKALAAESQRGSWCCLAPFGSPRT